MRIRPWAMGMGVVPTWRQRMKLVIWRAKWPMQTLRAMIANIHTIRYLERKERPLLMLSAIF